MNQRQENTLTMWTTVESILEVHQGIWQNKVAFEKHVANFRNIRQNLDPQATTQFFSQKGVALNKNILRVQLSELALQLAANLESFAIDNNDSELNEQVHYPITAINKLRDNALPLLVTRLLEMAQGNATVLQDYGVEAQNLLEIQEKLNQYNNVNASPRVASGKKKLATAQIAALFAEGKKALEQMDRLLGNFNNTAPAFVAKFKNARMVINLGHRYKEKKPSPGTPIPPPNEANI